MFEYLKKYWLFSLMAPLFMLLEVAMDLSLPMTMAKIVDKGIANHDLELVLNLGFKMVVITCISFVSGASCAIFASYSSTGVGASLREDLYKKIQTLSNKNLDKLQTSKLIVRLTNDVSQIEEATRMLLRIMMRTPFQIIGSLIMAIMISKYLSVLFIIFVPILLVATFIVMKKAYPLFSKMQNYIDKLNTRIQENITGKRLVKVFVREEYEKEKFQDANNDLVNISIKSSRTISSIFPFMSLILNLAIIATLWLGANQINFNLLKIGALIAFINYLRQLLFSLLMLSGILVRFSRSQASAKRIQEVFDNQPDIENSPNAKLLKNFKGNLEFKNVTFSYDKDGEPVLKNINFKLKQGETLAIIGATGSGKSTIAELINRFYEVDSGEVLVDEQNIKNLDIESLRSQIAFVPQRTLLFSGSIKSNILFSYDKNQHKSLIPLMKEAAHIAHIDKFIETLPKKYSTNINQKGVNFSGGQRQRIAIARALAKKSPLIIFDDSTSAIDMATEKAIRTSLKQATKQQTTIIIAQRISSIINADIIIALDDGEITGIGTHQELLETNLVYQEIYNSQIDREIV